MKVGTTELVELTNAEMREEIKRLTAEAIEWRRQVERAERELATWKMSEKALSDAYLRLREILGAFGTPHAPSVLDVWGHTEAAAERLTAELAAAREDVERVEWLDTSWVCVRKFPRFQWMSDKTGSHPMSNIPKSTRTLREAIDDARARKGEG